MFHNKIFNLQKSVKNKKFAALAIFIIVVAGIFWYADKSNANVLDDIKNFFKKESAKEQVIKKPSEQILGNTKIFQEERSSHEQKIINAVKKASPAVVSIVISKDVPVVEQCPYNPFSNIPQEFQDFFDFGGGFQFYQPCEKGTKKQEVGGGSGFIISSDGLVITNKHVVSDDKADYTVFTNDGKKHDAKVLARHPSIDLAIIKINAADLPTIKLGDSSAIELGQTAVAIGNALGEFRNTVSVGIVSGLARNVTASDGATGQSEMIENVIQTDAAINPGNSGGPLLNSSGEVIGINVAMVSGAQSIGFAIPINAAKKSIESVISSGKIRVAYIGVRYITLNSDIAKQYDVKSEAGALIKGSDKDFAVESGSPAEKAGLKEGDVIVEIDGQKIDKDHSLAYIISQKNPGDKIVLKIIRGEKEMNADVVLGERK